MKRLGLSLVLLWSSLGNAAVVVDGELYRVDGADRLLRSASQSTSFSRFGRDLTRGVQMVARDEQGEAAALAASLRNVESQMDLHLDYATLDDAQRQARRVLQDALSADQTQQFAVVQLSDQIARMRAQIDVRYGRALALLLEARERELHEAVVEHRRLQDIRASTSATLSQTFATPRDATAFAALAERHAILTIAYANARQRYESALLDAATARHVVNLVADPDETFDLSADAASNASLARVLARLPAALAD